ncbi:MAG: ferritin-like domain-containing protein [Polyangiales bacterium]
MARLALRVLPLAIAAIAAPSAVRADPSMVLSVGPFGGLLGGAGALQGGGGVEASLLRFNRPMSRDAFLVGGVAQLAGFVRNSEGTLYGMLGGEIAYGGAGIEAGAYGQSAGGGYGASVGVHLGAFLSLGVLYVSGGVHVPVVQAVAPDPLGVQGFLFIGAKYPITVRGDDPYASLFNFSFGRGRPLVRDDAPVIAAREASAAWLDGRATDLAGLDAATRAALARAWLDDARAEHASIAAFTRLSMQLLAAGAPPDLLAETHRAAIDEVRHAQRCFTLASAYGAARGARWPLDRGDPRGALRPRDARAEALLDGCVGEGVAAVVARASSDDARDPEVRERVRSSPTMSAATPRSRGRCSRGASTRAAPGSRRRSAKRCARRRRGARLLDGAPQRRRRGRVGGVRTDGSVAGRGALRGRHAGGGGARVGAPRDDRARHGARAEEAAPPR